MAGFEKTKLLSGEFRKDYILRRLAEGATVKAIHGEINAPDLYAGLEGKAWPESVVYAAKPKPEAPPAVTIKTAVTKPATKAVPDVALTLADVAVPPEYEGILDAEDIAEVRAEAAELLRKEQRAQARKDLLKQATADLKRELALEAQRGEARGDMVDVTIDLAPYSDRLAIDGVPYLHGKTYRVPRRVYNTIAEMLQRSWQHEGTLHGANDRPYRRSLNERGLTANNFREGVRA